MEGPYRDLGAGFARLTGPEGARRGPSPISHVEDALLELLRNARDAGADNIFVASTLTKRRFRTLVVIDDGAGIPNPYSDLVFEPGVTTRHLVPVPDLTSRTGSHHGAGLSLYHVREAAVSAGVLSSSSPTAIRVTFDTQTIPERTLQSTSRPSKTNLLATLETFTRNTAAQPSPNTYYGSPARVLAALLENRIIHRDMKSPEVRRFAAGVGLQLSLRTVQRVIGARVAVADRVLPVERSGRPGVSRGGARGGGATLSIGEREKAEIAAILGRAARAGYLEVEDLRLESRPGEILLRARVYEPEEEYE